MGDSTPPPPPPAPAGNGTEIRLRAVEQGMFVLLGSLQYPGGKIEDIRVEFTDIRDEIGPRLDKVLNDWVTSPEFSANIANTVIVVLKARRGRLVKALSKPLVQLALGVVATVLATLIVLWITHTTPSGAITR